MDNRVIVQYILNNNSRLNAGPIHGGCHAPRIGCAARHRLRGSVAAGGTLRVLAAPRPRGRERRSARAAAPLLALDRGGVGVRRRGDGTDLLVRAPDVGPRPESAARLATLARRRATA